MGIQEKITLAFEIDEYLNNTLSEIKTTKLNSAVLSDIAESTVQIQIPSDDISSEPITGTILKYQDGVILVINEKSNDKIKEILRQLA